MNVLARERPARPDERWAAVAAAGEDGRNGVTRAAAGEGTGVSPERLRRFFRAADHRAGDGLGVAILAIAKGLIEAMRAAAANRTDRSALASRRPRILDGRSA